MEHLPAPSPDFVALAPALWRFVDRGTRFPWPRTPGAAASLGRSLARLIDEPEAAGIMLGDDREQANVDLRQLVAPRLLSGKRETTAGLGQWIVAEWGGIRRGAEAVPAWQQRLGGFDDAAVARFVTEEGTRRISSWSKLLAFARPDSLAIYDARTAVALNCALRRLKDADRFFMPAGRNGSVEPARRMLLAEQRNGSLGYPAYIHLLAALVSHGGALDILRAEMTLFANAPLLAEELLEERRAA